MRRWACGVLFGLCASAAYASGVPKFDFANWVSDVIETALKEEVRAQIAKYAEAEMELLSALTGYGVNIKGNAIAEKAYREIDARTEINNRNAIVINRPPSDSCRIYSLSKAASVASATKTDLYKLPNHSAAGLMSYSGDSSPYSKAAKAALSDLADSHVSLFKEFVAGQSARGPGGGADTIFNRYMNNSYTDKQKAQLLQFRDLLTGAMSAGALEGDGMYVDDRKSLQKLKNMARQAIVDHSISSVMVNKALVSGRMLGANDLAALTYLPASSKYIQSIIATEGDGSGRVAESLELIKRLALEAPFVASIDAPKGGAAEEVYASLRRDQAQLYARAYDEFSALDKEASELAMKAIEVVVAMESLTKDRLHIQ